MHCWEVAPQNCQGFLLVVFVHELIGGIGWNAILVFWGGSSPGHYLARLAIAGLDYQMVDPGGYGSEKVLGGALPPLLRSLELVCSCIRT